jgi:hypothetical protein
LHGGRQEQKPKSKNKPSANLKRGGIEDAEEIKRPERQDPKQKRKNKSGGKNEETNGAPQTY